MAVISARIEDSLKEQVDAVVAFKAKPDFTYTVSDFVGDAIKGYLRYLARQGKEKVSLLPEVEGDGVNPTEKLVPYQRGVKYQPGTMVIYKGRIIRAPEIDGEGNTMPEE